MLTPTEIQKLFDNIETQINQAFDARDVKYEKLLKRVDAIEDLVKPKPKAKAKKAA
jgi:hypothetical protein